MLIYRAPDAPETGAPRWPRPVLAAAVDALRKGAPRAILKVPACGRPNDLELIGRQLLRVVSLPLGDGRFRGETVDVLVISRPTVSLGYLPLGQRGRSQSPASGLLQLDLPDHKPIGVQLEVEPDGFLVPEAANPAFHGFTASKGSSCQRQPAVPSPWMCSMNSATRPPSGNVRLSSLRICV